MFQSIFQSLIGCTHRRTTFPMTPRRRSTGVAPARSAYVVCLDCGREFAYDWNEMRVGEQVNARTPVAAAQSTA